MQLEQLSVVLRQRNPWEAIDLGFAMVREWWRDVYGAWLVVYVPLAVAACLLLPPLWASLLVWWLKPALDRIVLHVVASAVFGARPRLRDTLRSYFSYAANGLVSSLIPFPFYRFSMLRSFGLAVRQLENARGRDARLRIKQLRKRVASHAMWLTFMCLNFETVAWFSIIGLLDLLIPAGQQVAFNPFDVFQPANTMWRDYFLAGLFLTAIALIEPLYVAGGFALYLNRRTMLEGWDLEVQLRRLAQRTRAPEVSDVEQAPAAAATFVALSLGLALWFAMPGSGAAEDVAHSPQSDAPIPQEMHVPDAPAPAPAPTPRISPRSRAAQEVKAVLDSQEFQAYQTRTVLQSLHPSEDEPDRPKKDKPAWGDGNFLMFVAEVLRGLAWVVLAAVLLFALYWLARQLNWIRRTPETRWAPPDTLFGLDVRPESLPDDVATAALELARAGRLVEALSLLYRGALTTLLHRDQVELASGDTETECLRKAQARVAAPTLDYLARLLGAWQRAAYAHRTPTPPDVERLAAEWAGYFRPVA